MKGTRHGAVLVAAAAAALLATPAQAQFGFGLPSLTRSAKQTSTDGCPKGKSKSAGAAIMGSVLGGMANRAAGRLSSWVPLPEVAQTLTNAIACKLDPDEQKQAAEATLTATRGNGKTGDVEVGASSEWQSSSRENVRGRSTVIARNEAGGGMPQGTKCITVSDVIIVNGEETTANKRMCRPPGSARYSLMA